MPALTVSGSEITDLARANALAWLSTQQGGSVDEYQSDSSFGIYTSATNLFREGQCNSSGNGWSSFVFGGGTSTIAADATTPAPFSPKSIKVTVDGTATRQGVRANTNTGLAVPTGQLGHGSIWMKGTAGQSYLVITRWLTTGGAVIGQQSLTLTATGNWQLVIVPSNACTANADRFLIEVETNSARAESFWVAHAMLESVAAAGRNYVTPYIATASNATASRSAARVQGPASLLSTGQGWVAVRVRLGWKSSAKIATNGYVFSLDDGTQNNRIVLFWNAASARWEAQRVAGGVTSGVAFAADTVNYGDVRTLIVAWDGANIKISLAGAAFVSTANANAPAVSNLNIGANETGAQELDGDIFWLACGSGTLSNANAVTINGYGNAGPTFSQLAALNIGPTALWGADTSYYDPQFIGTATASAATFAPSSSLKTTCGIGIASAGASVPTAKTTASAPRAIASTAAVVPHASVTWPPVTTPLPARMTTAAIMPVFARGSGSEAGGIIEIAGVADGTIGEIP